MSSVRAALPLLLAVPACNAIIGLEQGRPAGAGGEASSSPASSGHTSSTHASASNAASSAMSSQSAGGAGGQASGVTCYTDACAPGEACCVDPMNADVNHSCTAANLCETVSVSCRSNLDCNAGQTCCAVFTTDPFPAEILCADKCGGGGVLPTCSGGEKCATGSCEQAFCVCDPADPSCVCSQGKCTTFLPLKCSMTPYKACF